MVPEFCYAKMKKCKTKNLSKPDILRIADLVRFSLYVLDDLTPY